MLVMWRAELERLGDWGKECTANQSLVRVWLSEVIDQGWVKVNKPLYVPFVCLCL